MEGWLAGLMLVRPRAVGDDVTGTWTASHMVSAWSVFSHQRHRFRIQVPVH